MKIRYLEFKNDIAELYDREIVNYPNPEEGIEHEWIEYDGCCYDKINFQTDEGEIIWDEDFLKDYELAGPHGNMMIRRI